MFTNDENIKKCISIKNEVYFGHYSTSTDALVFFFIVSNTPKSHQQSKTMEYLHDSVPFPVNPTFLLPPTSHHRGKAETPLNPISGGPGVWTESLRKVC